MSNYIKNLKRIIAASLYSLLELGVIFMIFIIALIHICMLFCLEQAFNISEIYRKNLFYFKNTIQIFSFQENNEALDINEYFSKNLDGLRISFLIPIIGL
jgi:hypothetical protein